jgi:hypothetical protein
MREDGTAPLQITHTRETQWTSIITWAFSMRLSLLTEKSSRGAASSSVSPASSRICRSRRASTRRRTMDPSCCVTSLPVPTR